MSSSPKRIDVHHHVLPPEHLADLARRGVAWTGGAAIPNWNVSIAREVMERNGIAAAIASPMPSVYWGDAPGAVRWARHCNEFLAGIVRDDPTHFGGFATLPIPDTGAACKELGYALDTLGLDGVLLWASQGAQYLGDPDFEELFQELDRRGAVVFIHPSTSPPGSQVPKLALPYFLVEFIFDTTRAITNLLYSGTFERHPSIRYIVAHAGGAVPYLAWRLALGQSMPGLRENAPRGALPYLQRLYYDTALSPSEQTLASLLELVPHTQVLFGSDYPMAPEPVVKAETATLEANSLLDADARGAIDRGNALALFPRFAKLTANS